MVHDPETHWLLPYDGPLQLSNIARELGESAYRASLVHGRRSSEITVVTSIRP